MSQVYTRPDWDQYFLDIAQAVSKRATCSRASVGCVIVNTDHNIIATGYNGAPSGLRHCVHDQRPEYIHAWQNRDEVSRYGAAYAPVYTTVVKATVGDTKDGHCTRAQHAERNAVAQAAKHGVRLDGSTCYLTAGPCLECARLLVSAGIKRVLWLDAYRSAGGVQDAAVELFKEAGVEYHFKPAYAHDVG